MKKSYFKEYKNNTELMYAAANSLGYTTEKMLDGSSDPLSHYGFTISHRNKICFISEHCIFPDVPKWQAKLFGDKILTNSILKSKGYHQIDTIYISHRKKLTNADISKIISAITLPVIIKPTKGRDGKGLIKTYNRKTAIKSISNILAQGESAIVQPYIEGSEYRIFVSMGQVFFIHKKRFPQIVGDGKSTINQLLKASPYIDPDTVYRELLKQKFELTTVLPEGAIFKTHFTKKTDPEYFEDVNISKYIRNWAEKLCRTLSVKTVGIDVVISGTLNRPTKMTIIELNSNPGLRYLTKYYNDVETPINTARKILKLYFTQKPTL